MFALLLSVGWGALGLFCFALSLWDLSKLGQCGSIWRWQTKKTAQKTIDNIIAEGYQILFGLSIIKIAEHHQFY